MPLSFKAKREAQDSLNLQNDILDGNPSFAEKRNAQRQKDSLMETLGIIDEKGNVIGDETIVEPEEAKKVSIEYFSKELNDLKSETDIDVFDKSLDDIYARVDASGFSQELDTVLNEVADKLTALLNFAEQALYA